MRRIGSSETNGFSRDDNEGAAYSDVVAIARPMTAVTVEAGGIPGTQKKTKNTEKGDYPCEKEVYVKENQKKQRRQRKMEDIRMVTKNDTVSLRGCGSPDDDKDARMYANESDTTRVYTRYQ